MSETYTLSLKFEGLCALVDDPNGNGVIVLLVDATNPAAHAPGNHNHGGHAGTTATPTVHERHIPLINFSRSDLATPEAELPGTVRFLQSRPGHWEGEWVLDYEDLSLGFTSGSAPKDPFKFEDIIVLTGPDPEEPEEPETSNARDFSWIPDFRRVDEDASFVKPGCISERDPRAAGVVARMALSFGKLGAAYDVDGSPLIHFATQEDPAENAIPGYEKEFATFAELRVENLSGPLTLYASKFDGSGTSHLSFRQPTGDSPVLSITVRNALSRDSTYKAPIKGEYRILEHFTMLYSLSERPPTNPRVPVYSRMEPEFPSRTCLSGGRMSIRPEDHEH